MNLASSPHLRWLIATLLGIELPVCCCTGPPIARALGVVMASHAFAGADDKADGPHIEPPGESRGGCCASTDKGRNPVPCKDDGPCDCGQHKQIKQVPEGKATLGAPSPLVVVLPSVDRAVWAPKPAARARRGAAKAVTRPPSSLLRLHCALTI